ncbi:hypothetical protein JCM18549_01220 [Halolamina salina]
MTDPVSGALRSQVVYERDAVAVAGAVSVANERDAVAVTNRNVAIAATTEQSRLENAKEPI